MKRLSLFMAVCVAGMMLAGCGPSTEPRVEKTNQIDLDALGGASAKEQFDADKNVAATNDTNSSSQATNDTSSSSLTAKDMFEQGIIPQEGQTTESNAGNYMLDVSKTESEMGGRKLADVFDKYSSDGSAMKLAEDGAFAFYVGKKGGAGTWQQDGACIKLRITDYADAHNYEVVLNPYQDNGRTVFCMNYEGVNLYWVK